MRIYDQIQARINELNERRPLPREGQSARDGEMDGLKFALSLIKDPAFPWIQCSKQMPEDDDQVLVYTAAGHYAEDWVDKDTGDFMHCPSQWPFGLIPVKVLEHGSYATHWMPLPTPPDCP